MLSPIIGSFFGKGHFAICFSAANGVDCALITFHFVKNQVSIFIDLAVNAQRVFGEQHLFEPIKNQCAGVAIPADLAIARYLCHIS